MAAKKITIVLLPEGGRKVRQIKVPRFLFFLLLIFTVLISGIFGWVIVDYQAVRKRTSRLAQLQKENTQQKQQLVTLAQKIDAVNDRVKELKEFDTKLRTMVNLESPTRDNSQFVGIGGSDPNLLNPRSTSEKTHRKLIRLMHKSLDNLETEISVQKTEKKELIGRLERQKSMLASTPSIWPVKGWISSTFGYRQSPFTGEKEFHRGLDICNRKDSTIVAPADGVVASVEFDDGYGRIVTINHGYGVTTRYAHLDKALVKKGQAVKRGQEIGLVGNTGRSTGPHLHYEVVLNGVPVNPFRYILN
jgi:murein DD-endopeptidase MepM/ murein hydrolase activator NlpD